MRPSLQLTSDAYENINTHLDEIQKKATDGVLGDKARDSLFDINAIVYRIRDELKNGTIIL